MRRFVEFFSKTASRLLRLAMAAVAIAAASSMHTPSDAQEPAARSKNPKPYAAALRRYRGEGLGAGKVIGGEDASWDNHRWQAALLVAMIADTREAQFCGGSVLNERWIVTAAHCVEDQAADNVHVLTGTSSLESGGRRVNVDRILVHKDYNSGTMDNDIALVETRSSVTGVPVKRLAKANEPAVLAAGSELMVTGWGVTDNATGNTAVSLKQLKVPFVARETCNSRISYNGDITENMICAGFAEGGKDSCQGDSGGPLTAAAEGEPVLAGVVSWGSGCAQPAKFGIYTRLANYEDWVDKCLAEPDACPAKKAPAPPANPED